MPNWSLGEFKSTVNKAARGAGLPWGMAEEIGNSAVWLVRYGMADCSIIGTYLLWLDERDLLEHLPLREKENWRAKGGILCPTILGTFLMDCGEEHASFFKDIVAPVLLLPYLAKLHDGPVAIEANGGQLFWDGYHIWQDGAADLWSMQEASQLDAIYDAKPRGKQLANRTRVDLSDELIEILNGFCQRTYAPETPERMKTGAGAGLTDRD